MSWFSQFVHNPGDMIKHHPWKALSIIGAPIAAIAAPFVAPELAAMAGGAGLFGAGAGAAEGVAAGAGIGALEEAGLGAGLAAGGEAALGGGEAALGLGTFGSEALGFAPEAGLGGMLPESIPGGFLEAGAGTPASFYEAVGMGAGAPASTAGAAVPADITGAVTADVTGGGIGGAGALSPEMAAGAPFADSPVGQAMVNAGLVPANASPSMMTSAMNWIKANPMMAATLGLGGLGMAKNLIGGIPNQGQLKGIAGQAGAQATALGAQGQGLLGPIEGGPLPGPLEQQVQNGIRDADAATKSRFAKLGLSGSTMETDALNNNQNQAQALRGTLALQLAQAGAQLISLANQDLGIEAGIFTNLMNAQIAQDSALEQSIARFAGSAAMASAISSRKAA